MPQCQQQYVGCSCACARGTCLCWKALPLPGWLPGEGCSPEAPEFGLSIGLNQLDVE